MLDLRGTFTLIDTKGRNKEKNINHPLLISPSFEFYIGAFEP